MYKLSDEFELNLSSWINDITRDINEIKLYAPKSSNGEIEECSYLKVKQAQLEVLRCIQFSFRHHVLEPLKNESEELE
jgi:midasin (ATPase involved in ribosome maturation)